MAKITFKIEGPPGTVTLRAMLLAFKNQLTILSDLDMVIAGVGEPVLDWVVSDLHMSSVSGTLESRHRTDAVPFGHDIKVIRTYHNGWALIEGEGGTPAYYSDRSLRASRSTLKLIGNEGITGYEIEEPSAIADSPVRLSSRGAVNVDQLIKPGRQALGSIEGRLSVISLKRHPKFEVITTINKKAVSCQFGEDQLEEVKAALGKRVIVTGTLTYNAKCEPHKIARTSDIRILRSRGELPSAASMAGAFPDLTGGMTTAEYLELVRG